MSKLTNKRHTIDYYMDGFKVIAFCKACSAEGEKLFEGCQGKPDLPKQLDTRQKDLDNQRDYLDSIK